MSLRTDVARDVGGWDASLARAADWDLWKRALAAGARSARSPEPTVLHFRATGREQAWPLRVGQNTAWLTRLEGAARRELAKAHEHAAALDAHRVAAEAEATRLAATLTRIYDGGWWRLRRLVLAL